MKTSEQIGNIASALATAQAEYPSIDKNRHVKVTFKNGGGYEHDYATFDNILAAIRPVLGKHGLAVLQGIETSETKDEKDGAIYIIVTVTTRIVHASGEWFEDSIWAVAENGEPQKIGSCTTYLKRYAYCSMLNIAAEEDDDGAAAAGHESTPTARGTAKKPATNGHAKKEPPASEAKPQTEGELRARLDKYRGLVRGSPDAQSVIGLRVGAKNVFTGAMLDEALFEANWKLAELDASPFQAACTAIATVYDEPTLKLATALIDGSQVFADQKEKDGLYSVIRGQRRKIEEPQDKATQAA